MQQQLFSLQIPEYLKKITPAAPKGRVEAKRKNWLPKSP